MSTLATIVKTIHGILLPVAAVVGLFLIVINGYGLMTSEGDPQKVQHSKEGLTSAIIGLIFVLGSVAILRVIFGAIFGSTF